MLRGDSCGLHVMLVSNDDKNASMRSHMTDGNDVIHFHIPMVVFLAVD
jgi:hypothetical protein